MRAILFFLFFTLLPGCAGNSGIPAENGGFTFEVVASGLDTPWALAFAPDGRIFVTERPGRVRLIRNGVLEAAPFATIAASVETGEGGLMGMVLHPDFANNGWMYLSYTYDNGPGFTVRVERYVASDTSLSSSVVIIDGIEGGSNHNGCELSFGPDGKLFVTTGERFNGALAKDLSSLNGKTLRLNDDGTVPADNPFVATVGARPEIFSYGHRNAQGIAWQPVTNKMFQSEHGPSGSDAPGGGDEVNFVEAGKNYGWPDSHHDTVAAGTVGPIKQWTPAVAPGSCAFYTGTDFPSWSGDLFVACLRGKGLIRVKLNGTAYVSATKMFDALGRCREVTMAPDGKMYFTTSNRDGRGSPAATDDRVMRIVPE